MLNKFSVSLYLILACDFMDERKFVGSCFVFRVWGGETIFCRVKWLNTEEGGGQEGKRETGNGTGEKQ